MYREHSYDKERKTHTWAVRGDNGGLHVWIRDSGRDDANFGRYLGGMESHYHSPPEYMENSPPHHDDCWLLGGPCWHDGTSMYVTEFWIPFWSDGDTDDAAMLDEVERHYLKRFGA